MLYRLMHLAKTQCFECILLALGFVNWAFDQRNFYFAHFRCSLNVVRCSLTLKF